ncbi:citrate lyase acyl carrier protein [Marinisporobacter balticus]|uniref:Citrate lyase acyl carrier protein n=1 Tax=Marinisporobacter balticus TaxID=2018667 RepID=A0A4R2KXK7_9FIRM|nr:citrate lyase acyl carrier protein [Marinisporobacter balticus]TCO79331.1 citrate lyase subunit gamma (acyl carrier protein) [Marinisporobacter balticus]
MEIIKTGMAGTMESSDIHVIIEKNEEAGIKIFLNSTVEKQFGEQIEGVILKTLKEMDIINVVVRAMDRGALDCTIRARVQSAVMRSILKENELDWGLL